MNIKGKFRIFREKFKKYKFLMLTKFTFFWFSFICSSKKRSALFSCFVFCLLGGTVLNRMEQQFFPTGVQEFISSDTTINQLTKWNFSAHTLNIQAEWTSWLYFMDGNSGPFCYIAVVLKGYLEKKRDE